jgi:hypothetical protein
MRLCIVAGSTALIMALSWPCLAVPPQTATVTVHLSPRPVNTFRPSAALGAGIDGHEKGEIDRQLTPANVKRMLSAGLRSLTYRLRTELAGEAWHWNPEGTWSDPDGHEGYWTSAAEPGEPIHLSWGYRLPRRGNTLDQANNDGYSRIDDGDVTSFWKSSPYLDRYFTGDDHLIPQWVMIDLGRREPVTAIRILWGEPYARRFAVESGVFVGEENLSQGLPSRWQPFPRGVVQNGTGGEMRLALCAKPVLVRYIRLRLEEGSGTAPAGSTDVRDRLGFAIRELSIGTFDAAGRFTDHLLHGKKRDQQTTIYVSSTDPWHRAIDRDESIEQPGFDFILKSGLTNDLPLLIPVGVLYETPENAAAEIRYLKARGYPFRQVEMGEEADGQLVSPEHYAALYLEVAKAVHDVDPLLSLGGPSFQDIEPTQVPGRLDLGKAGWLRRFLTYLRERGRSDAFSFFSFEWYPFGDDCQPPGVQLIASTALLSKELAELQQGGLSANIPWIMAEYGFSAFAARAEIDIDGALFNADSVAHFFSLGGAAAYLYGYEPGEIFEELKCSAGNNTLFFRGEDGGITQPTATYWGARLLATEWVLPGDQPHDVYLADSDVRDEHGDSIITAYALHRPDDSVSVLVINKSPFNTYRLKLRFDDQTRLETFRYEGESECFQFSRAQYRLNDNGRDSYPIQSEPPRQTRIRLREPLLLPPYSMTVLRQRVSKP